MLPSFEDVVDTTPTTRGKGTMQDGGAQYSCIFCKLNLVERLMKNFEEDDVGTKGAVVVGN